MRLLDPRVWWLCLRLYGQAWSGRYSPCGDVARADCLVGFSFGVTEVGGVPQPGASNSFLARFAFDRFRSVPKILQKEIAEAYQPLDPGGRVEWIRQHRVSPGRYLDTREVAEQALAVMQANGWNRPLIVAHGHHVPRAAAVCRRLGMDVIVPAGLEKVPFCPGSTQPWTRGLWRWRWREAVAIAGFAWKGWL